MSAGKEDLTIETPKQSAALRRLLKVVLDLDRNRPTNPSDRRWETLKKASWDVIAAAHGN